ncbi:hypothetical protein [Acinetobacter sp. YH12152]|uniref:hypothetical protein n=1 Tax=Acinetobacter sp. YH12152 TaxID=2601132 RepID=UPI0015D198BF|nr:hypothetical protein [Acinetobacter sp. YH12152]
MEESKIKFTDGSSYEKERFIQSKQKTKDKRQKTKDKRQKTKDKRQLYQSDKSQAQKNRNMCGNLFKLVRSERFELPTP